MSTEQPTVTYRDIPGHPGYRVGDDGSVWSCIKLTYVKGRRGSLSVIGTEWKPMATFPLGKSGHLAVRLRGGKLHYVHKLVLWAFVGPRPAGLQACHFPDRDPANNRPENLRWDTPKANAADRVKHGTNNNGEQHNLAKLTDNIVRTIRAEYAEGKLTQKQLGEKYGVHESSVCQLVKRVTWRLVS